MWLVAIAGDEAVDAPLQPHEGLGVRASAGHALRPEEALLEEADLTCVLVVPHGPQHLGELLERLGPEVGAEMLRALTLEPCCAHLRVGRRPAAYAFVGEAVEKQRRGTILVFRDVIVDKALDACRRQTNLALDLEAAAQIERTLDLCAVARERGLALVLERSVGAF